MKNLPVLIIALLSLAGCSNYNVKKDLSYDKNNVPFGVFDMYEPVFDGGKKDRPVILAIHGGAWQGGDKSAMHRIADEFCPSGYVVLSINYRLSLPSPPGSPITWNGTPWPAQIEDCQTALKYFRDNAETLKINPNKIASLGISAGAHLATMLSLRDNQNRTKVAVDLDGEHDMSLGDDCMSDYAGIMTAVFGETYLQSQLGHGPPYTSNEIKILPRIQDINTLPFARPDVSVMIIHGASDNNVYVINAERLNTALKNSGADVEYIRLEGKDGFCHGNCWENPKVLPRLHAFLDKHLK